MNLPGLSLFPYQPAEMQSTMLPTSKKADSAGLKRNEAVTKNASTAPTRWQKAQNSG